MPSFNIVKELPENDSFRVAEVVGAFDLQTSKTKETFVGNIPIENEDWRIGVIVGRSGTGKSLISKHLFQKEYTENFPYKEKSILDDMPQGKGIKEITQTFNSVGFSSPPSWLKPYSALSQGEKMRVDFARAILSDNSLIVFDEFTSVIDREIAKIASFAIAKNIRRSEKRFIAVTCHFDVLEWLQPDWIFYTDTMSFEKKNSKDQRSKLESISATKNCGECLANIII